MDKKVNYILIGCGVIGIIIILAGSYLLYKTNQVSDVFEVTNTSRQDLPSSTTVATAISYSGVITMVANEKITLIKDDGSTEEFVLSDSIGMYDNRVRDAMKPVKISDIKKGARIQISKTTDNTDNSENISLTLY